tara:strand:- start:748 stop:924 length:177 start_codon:yes stop_codon:yes gene_type:complete
MNIKSFEQAKAKRNVVKNAYLTDYMLSVAELSTYDNDPLEALIAVEDEYLTNIWDFED